MKCVGIIPARYQSSRFPGKPLAQLAGKPMIVHVVQNALTARLIDEIIVATDDERILKTVVDHGYRAVMTSEDHSSGSDRVWEVAQGLDVDCVVNIQGDEPALPGREIDRCLRALASSAEIDVATLCRSITVEEAMNANIVKVVGTTAGKALYFSRSVIPFYRQDQGSGQQETYRGHVGLYAYRKSALERFCALPPSALEQCEKLEQLRGLEAGMHYALIQSDYRSIDVNVPEDIGRAEEALRRLQEK